MKKLFLLFFAIANLTICKAQQFFFQMNFVDAIGNTDSLILGYDTSATDSLDAAFGETNIISTPLNSDFDVRVTDELFNRQYFSTNGTFHTKKQIVRNHCVIPGLSIAAIDIYAKHFPITASWDSSVFNDTCRYGSLFTSFDPGGWWDVGGISDLGRIELMQINHITFSSQEYSIPLPPYTYINNTGDTISTFWFAMGDSTLLLSAIEEISLNESPLNVFPNPATDLISLSVNKHFGEVNCIEFYNMFGQIVLTSTQLNNVNISKFASGLYFIKATNRRGLTATTKLRKV